MSFLDGEEHTAGCRACTRYLPVADIGICYRYLQTYLVDGLSRSKSKVVLDRQSYLSILDIDIQLHNYTTGFCN